MYNVHAWASSQILGNFLVALDLLNQSKKRLLHRISDANHCFLFLFKESLPLLFSHFQAQVITRSYMHMYSTHTVLTHSCLCIVILIGKQA